MSDKVGRQLSLATPARRRAEPMRRFLGSLDRNQWRTLGLMAAVVVGLHALGFFVLIAVVAPHHYRLGTSGVFAVGTGLTAYTLGLRHAFDADHVAAIDNCTRKLMAGGKRPMSVGFFFSLGHSSVVFGLALLFTIGVRALGSQVEDPASSLHRLATWIGTGVSGGFLCIIAALNLVTLLGIFKMRREGGRFDQQQLERQLDSRGLMNRLLRRVATSINKPWQMYPIGLLFGLGFDTASEVALLFLAAGAAGAGLPFYAVLCLPILFAAGMSLLDTIEGSFMNLAYGWAFASPARKLFYNLTVTGLSVLVALLIGTVELAGLFAREFNARGSFWVWLEGIDINTFGLIVVGLFAATWGVAVAIWRFGRVEERWRPAGHETAA